MRVGGDWLYAAKHDPKAVSTLHTSESKFGPVNSNDIEETSVGSPRVSRAAFRR
jgi:hypothetical protein